MEILDLPTLSVICVNKLYPHFIVLPTEGNSQVNAHLKSDVASMLLTSDVGG